MLPWRHCETLPRKMGVYVAPAREEGTLATVAGEEHGYAARQ
jgi:hypothetical protein